MVFISRGAGAKKKSCLGIMLGMVGTMLEMVAGSMLGMDHPQHALLPADHPVVAVVADDGDDGDSAGLERYYRNDVIRTNHEVTAP